jgi:hypothetical protein
MSDAEKADDLFVALKGCDKPVGVFKRKLGLRLKQAMQRHRFHRADMVDAASARVKPNRLRPTHKMHLRQAARLLHKRRQRQRKQTVADGAGVQDHSFSRFRTGDHQKS